MAAPAFPRSVGANVAYIAPVGHHESLTALMDEERARVDLVDLEMRGVGVIAQYFKIGAREAGILENSECRVVAGESDAADGCVIELASQRFMGPGGAQCERRKKSKKSAPVHNFIIPEMRKPPPPQVTEEAFYLD